MTKNEIVGRLKDGGIDASSTNRNAAVYVTDARSGRSNAGWFAYRIVCNSEETERRARAILSRWYDIEPSGDVWRLKSKNRIPLMAIKRGAAPSENGYMYLEAAQANSTVSMVSTLETAPDLEYSTDGVNWQEWQHTTAEGTHTFDTITLGSIGDRVYLRGNNPSGLAFWLEGARQPNFSNFVLTGEINGGGDIMSTLDKTMTLTEVPQFGFMGLFAVMGEGLVPALLTPPSMDTITSIGNNGCNIMYLGCGLLTSAANMSALLTIGNDGCFGMYGNCTFNMSDDGTTLNFAFPTPPVTAGETIFATAYDIAQWMGNTNGF